MKSNDGTDSMTVLDIFMESISVERNSIPIFPEESFYAMLKTHYAESFEGMYLGIRRKLAQWPRTEIYKVPSDLFLPELGRLGEVLDYQKFSRPWVLQFVPADTNEYEVVVAHVASEGGKNHSFMKMWFSETRDMNLSFSSIEGTKLISTNESDQEELCWIMQLFLAMKSRQYVDVVGMKHTGKNKLKASASHMTSYKISLNEAGRRYHSAKSATVNATFKDGKVLIPVEIASFPRKQRVGKGRTEERIVNVRPFKRGQWVVPKDRIIKVTT